MIREFTEQERQASKDREAANKPWTFHKPSQAKPISIKEGKSNG